MNTSHTGLRSILIDYDLNLITSSKRLFTNKVTYTGDRVSTAAYLFGETEFNPQHPPELSQCVYRWGHLGAISCVASFVNHEILTSIL